ncbi:hypothetical protein [Aestuariicoccus sp. MJ-SS9]|uniref:hypothetical protein n=1 Tax=Aestuariicoccus sp. MJ-SS9 TaxID=3079855 RepID=UPI002909C43B|nr:hypothetical protein [Aestuariicoccus sp. MJ-SS9]MDU8913635.1 hypothetical protein [Aestuariicoccus sp. MJ-SS9]
MKRFLTATALTSLIATGAHALTANEEATIERFLPQVDATTLDRTEVLTLMNIANGGGTVSEKTGKMRSVVLNGGRVDFDLSTAQMDDIARLVPELDITALSDAEKAQAAAIVTSADSQSDAIAKLRAFANGDRMVMTGGLTEAEVLTLQQYAPGLDVAALSDEDIFRLKTAIGSENVSEIESVVAGITG